MREEEIAEMRRLVAIIDRPCSHDYAATLDTMGAHMRLSSLLPALLAERDALAPLAAAAEAYGKANARMNALVARGLPMDDALREAIEWDRHEVSVLIGAALAFAAHEKCDESGATKSRRAVLGGSSGRGCCEG